MTDTLDKTTPFPDPAEVERLLTAVEVDLRLRNREHDVARRRKRRITWGGGGFVALAAAALMVTGAIHPLGSILDPDGNGRAYLRIECYGPGANARPAEYSSANDDAAMRAQRENPAGVCTQMVQHAAVQRQLMRIQQRPDVQAAGSAIVYATDGSVWEFDKIGPGTSGPADGWSITGGPDPVGAIGYPRPTEKPYMPQHVGPKTIVIRGFSFALPTAEPQAVCVKNDVEFDVYVMRPGQNAEAVCSARGLVAQN